MRSLESRWKTSSIDCPKSSLITGEWYLMTNPSNKRKRRSQSSRASFRSRGLCSASTKSKTRSRLETRTGETTSNWWKRSCRRRANSQALASNEKTRWHSISKSILLTPKSAAKRCPSLFMKWYSTRSRSARPVAMRISFPHRLKSFFTANWSRILFKRCPLFCQINSGEKLRICSSWDSI